MTSGFSPLVGPVSFVLIGYHESTHVPRLVIKVRKREQRAGVGVRTLGNPLLVDLGNN